MKGQTLTVKKGDLKRNRRLLDVSGMTLGRVSSEIAQVLMGKHKVNFSKNINCGDRVVVVNAGKIKVSGKKFKDKKYYRVSGYMGGLKEESFGSLQGRRPAEAIRRAVGGMLPANKLRKERMSNLYIYAGKEENAKKEG